MRIAMDDFGTGYASLGRLKELPLDKVKIDRSFVAMIKTGQEQLPFFGTMINAAHALGLKVTAEGIETPAQARYLMGPRLRLPAGLPFRQARPGQRSGRNDGERAHGDRQGRRRALTRPRSRSSGGIIADAPAHRRACNADAPADPVGLTPTLQRIRVGLTPDAPADPARITARRSRRSGGITADAPADPAGYRAPAARRTPGLPRHGTAVPVRPRQELGWNGAPGCNSTGASAGRRGAGLPVTLRDHRCAPDIPAHLYFAATRCQPVAPRPGADVSVRPSQELGWNIVADR